MTMQTQSVKLSSVPVSHNLREFEELHDTEQTVRTFLQGVQAGMAMAKHLDEPGYMVKNGFKDKAVDLVAPAEKDETDEFAGVTFVARHHQALDADGKAVTDARVRLRIAPGSMRQYAFAREGDRYVCAVRKEDMAMVYDPDICDYAPLSGPARLILQAENDTLQGGCLVNVRL